MFMIASTLTEYSFMYLIIASLILKKKKWNKIPMHLFATVKQMDDEKNANVLWWQMFL